MGGGLCPEPHFALRPITPWCWNWVIHNKNNPRFVGFTFLGFPCPSIKIQGEKSPELGSRLSLLGRASIFLRGKQTPPECWILHTQSNCVQIDPEKPTFIPDASLSNWSWRSTCYSQKGILWIIDRKEENLENLRDDLSLTSLLPCQISLELRQKTCNFTWEFRIKCDPALSPTNWNLFWKRSSVN